MTSEVRSILNPSIVVDVPPRSTHTRYRDATHSVYSPALSTYPSFLPTKIKLLTEVFSIIARKVTF